jgi:3-deoxy-manno-octulosonate cytidylyltransferase (CMP-KDO synthetase)
LASRRVVGVVPARLDSTRFPGKVLAPIHGRPLLQHVFERLEEAGRVDEVMVATDSDQVAEAAASFGGRVAMVRTPCATGSDRVAAAVAGMDADVVINLQADQPMIAPADIDMTVEALETSDAVDLVTLAFGADDRRGYESPDVVKVVAGEGGRALYFSRSPVPHASEGAGDRPLYLHHVGIYCFRRAALERFASCERGTLEQRESLEQLRAIENGMAVGLVLTDTQTVSVDRPGDIALVEKRMRAS